MAKLTDIEQLRRRRARQKLARNFMVLLVLGAIVFAVSVVVGNLGKTELKAAVSDIRAEISSGSGFPVPLPGGRFVRMTSMGGTLVLQTDTNLYTYNETGRQTMNLQHGMSNVVLSSSRDRMLAYDRGGTRVQLLSRSAVLQSMDTKFSIFDGDLGSKGIFAIATGSDEYLAQVSVYDGELRNIFNWYSAERPIISVSVSDAKETMVVGCVDVYDGSYRSEIQRFQFNMDKAMARVELEKGELLLSLDYHGPNGIRAITDKRVVLLSQELKELREFRLDNQKVMRFSWLEDGKVVLVTQGLTGGRSDQLTLLDADFQVAAQFAVPTGLLSVGCDGEQIYLTERDKISIRKMDGSEQRVVIAGGLHGAQLVGGRLYYATASEIFLLEDKNTSSSKPSAGKKPPGGASQNASSSDGGTGTSELQPVSSDEENPGISSLADTESVEPEENSALQPQSGEEDSKLVAKDPAASSQADEKQQESGE